MGNQSSLTSPLHHLCVGVGRIAERSDMIQVADPTTRSRALSALYVLVEFLQNGEPQKTSVEVLWLLLRAMASLLWAAFLQ